MNRTTANPAKNSIYLGPSVIVAVVAGLILRFRGRTETELGTPFTTSNLQKFKGFNRYRVRQLGTGLGTDTGQ